MQKTLCAVAALGLAASASLVLAAELKSGLPAGATVGAFEVIKCSGAVADGVDEGEQLCYRCRLGNRPVVMVFARTPDARLAELAKALDTSLAAHQDKKLSAFINMLGKDKPAVEQAARQFGTQNKLERVAIVVPVDTENGPSSYQVNPQADVTVLVYSQGTVRANYAFGAGGLTESAIQAIVADAEKMLN